jgi:hypothetical protein
MCSSGGNIRRGEACVDGDNSGVTGARGKGGNGVHHCRFVPLDKVI